ncbi:MAG: calcium/sodium antiporter [Flavobacteriales bacterium]
MIPFLLIALSIVILIVAGDYLVKGAVSIALRSNISMMIVGLTVVSFATSAPELFVSLMSALKGNSDIALGNVIGSNIANITLVLGPTALIFPIVVQKRVYRFDWAVMAIFSVLFGLFMYTNNTIAFWEGSVLFVGLLAYVYSMIVSVKRDKKQGLNVEDANDDDEDAIIPNWKSALFIILGVIGLWYGSKLLIEQVEIFAKQLGVTDRVISLTVVAFGTSIPELTASLMAAYKGRKDLSVGNLIGSNIFNIASVIGITSMIKPIQLTSVDQLFDWAWMFGGAVLLLFLILMNRENKITRFAGGILLLFYIVYVLSLIL